MVDVYKTVETKSGKINNVLNFINNNNFYFAIGRSFPWDDDEDPPVPSSTARQLDDVILYKKCMYAAPVVQSGCGTVQVTNCGDFFFKGDTWEVIDLEKTPDSVLEEIDPSFILIEGVLEAREYTQFRSMALFMNLSFVAGTNVNKLTYSPSEVSSTGVMYRVVYHTPIISTPNKVCRLKMLIKL